MIGKPFIKLNSVDSTNNYAMDQLKKGSATAGTAYFAMEQTKGKGQRSKQWDSGYGKNILMSVIVDTSAFDASDTFILSYAVALSVHDLFNKYSLSDTAIKWPNDLYWRDRKAGGILIENVWQNNKWLFSIVGTGININETSFQNDKAVSLKQITGREFSILDLAVELCAILDVRLESLTDNKHSVLAEFNDVLYKRGERVSFLKNGELFKATVHSVNEDGELLIYIDHLIKLRHGDAEWLIN